MQKAVESANHAWECRKLDPLFLVDVCCSGTVSAACEIEACYPGTTVGIALPASVEGLVWEMLGSNPTSGTLRFVSQRLSRNPGQALDTLLYLRTSSLAPVKQASLRGETNTPDRTLTG